MGVTDGQPMVPRPGMSRREKLELWQARRAAVAVQPGPCQRSLAARRRPPLNHVTPKEMLVQPGTAPHPQGAHRGSKKSHKTAGKRIAPSNPCAGGPADEQQRAKRRASSAEEDDEYDSDVERQRSPTPATTSTAVLQPTHANVPHHQQPGSQLAQQQQQQQQQQAPRAGEQEQEQEQEQQVEDSEFVNPCVMVSGPTALLPPSSSASPPPPTSAAVATEGTAMDIIDEQTHDNPVHNSASAAPAAATSGAGTPRVRALPQPFAAAAAVTAASTTSAALLPPPPPTTQPFLTPSLLGGGATAASKAQPPCYPSPPPPQNCYTAPPPRLTASIATSPLALCFSPQPVHTGTQTQTERREPTEPATPPSVSASPLASGPVDMACDASSSDSDHAGPTLHAAAAAAGAAAGAAGGGASSTAEEVERLSKQVVSLEFANDVLMQQLGEARSKLAKHAASSKRAMEGAASAHAQEVGRWKGMMDSTVSSVQAQMKQLLEGSGAKIKSLQQQLALSQQALAVAQQQSQQQQQQCGDSGRVHDEAGAVENSAAGLALPAEPERQPQPQLTQEQEQEKEEDQYEMTPEPREDEEEQRSSDEGGREEGGTEGGDVPAL